MTISTPSTQVVEIDDLWFRIKKFRGRRSTRAAMSLTKLLGGGVVTLLASPQFEATDERKRLKSLAELIGASAMTGGKGTDPDVFEKNAGELLHYTPASGGQGVSFAETKLDPAAEGWIPMANIASLDAYDWVDYATILALLWEVIKLTMRPTRAGTGTAGGTGPADGTSSADRTGPTTGTRSTRTRPMTGCVEA